MPDAPKATAKAASVLAGPGRAICEVRGHRYPLDAPPLIGGPNEEVNPVEAMVAALAACGALFLQHLSQAMGVPLGSVRTEAEGDFDPRGVKGEGPDPILSAVRLRYLVTAGAGTDRKGVERLIEAFRARCPVHRTFSKAVAIQEEIVLQ